MLQSQILFSSNFVKSINYWLFKASFNMKNKTLVLGASTNPGRYSYLAVQRLLNFGHEVVAIGRSTGSVFGIQIENEPVQFEEIDTVTLYLNPQHQKQYYDYVISLNPRRVIFNPGTENPEFVQILKEKGILTEEACTLVLLGTNQY